MEKIERASLLAGNNHANPMTRSQQAMAGIRQLGAIAHPEAAIRLHNLMQRDMGPELVAEVLDAIGHIGKAGMPHTGNALIWALDDRSEGIRYQALHHASNLPPELLARHPGFKDALKRARYSRAESLEEKKELVKKIEKADKRKS
ncbi:MAG: hypothetical protein Q8P02_02695 [Candidatus Micrarchaeota archaeon]|nr:hypothetical protein [Candidatus Micrarchaeota archaeon]